MLNLAHSGYWRYFDGEMTFNAFERFKDILGCEKEFFLSYGVEGTYKTYFNKEDWEKSGHIGLEVLKDPKRMSNFISESELSAEKLVEHANSISSHDFKKLTNEELSSLFITNYEKESERLAYYQLSNKEYVDKAYKYAISSLDKELFDKKEIINLLTFSDTSRLGYYQENDAWLYIIEEYLNKNKKIEDDLLELLKNHERNFGFLGVSASRPYGFKVEDYLEKLSKTSKTDFNILRSNILIKKHRFEKNDHVIKIILDRQKISGDVENIFKSIAALAKNRLLLSEASQHNKRLREPLLEEIYIRIRRKLDIRTSYLRMLSKDEIVDFLLDEKCVNVNLIIMRYKTSLTIYQNKKIEHYVGLKAQHNFNEFIAVNKNNKINDNYKGDVVVGEGHSFGRAVVLSAKHLKNEKSLPSNAYKNKIVVVPMIHSNIMPALISAVAVITEEGGYTSHAAVLARELKIPTIVNVEHATEIFNNNDILKIDFENESIDVVSELDHNIESNKQLYKISKPIPVNTSVLDTSFENKSGASSYIYKIKALNNIPQNFIGGKGYNLSKIREVTPNGFILATKGLKEIVEYSQVIKKSLLDNTDISSKAWTELTKNLVDYEKIVIRSSQGDEDVEGSTHAGIYKSFTNIQASNHIDILNCLIEIYNSSSSTLSNNYKATKRITKSSEPVMAVIFQSMIKPMISGVTLTNVKKKNKEWLLCEFQPGHLESIVNGQITPFRTTIERNQLINGIFEKFNPPYLETFLEFEVFTRLINTFLKIEKKFKVPIEIEWAINERNEIYIFQVRPIV